MKGSVLDESFSYMEMSMSTTASATIMQNLSHLHLQCPKNLSEY